MNKELTVTISGRPGHGKTTLAYVLSDFLNNLGAKVTIVDEDQLSPEEIAKKLENAKQLMNDHKITIQTKQVLRNVF